MALRTVGCQLNQAVHQIHQASGKTLRIRWCSSGSSSSGISSSSSGSIPATGDLLAVYVYCTALLASCAVVGFQLVDLSAGSQQSFASGSSPAHGVPATSVTGLNSAWLTVVYCAFSDAILQLPGQKNLSK